MNEKQKRILYLLYPVFLLIVLLVCLVPLVHDLRFRRGLMLFCLAIAMLHVGVLLSRNARAVIALTGLDILAVASLAAMVRRRIFVFDYDSWTHMALAMRVTEHGFFPGDPHLAGAPTPPFLSLLHWLLAVLHLGTGIEIPVLFAWSGVVGILLHLTVMALLAAAWFRRADAVLLTVVITAAANILALPMQGYPWRLGVTLLLFALWCRSELDGRRRSVGITPRDLLPWMVATGLCYGLCISLHLFAGIACSLFLVIFEIVLIVQEPPLRRASWRQHAHRLWYLPLGLFIGSPWILNTARQMLAASDANLWHHQAPDFPRLFGLWEIADWGRLLAIYPWVLIVIAGAGLLLTVPGIRRRLSSVRLLPPARAGTILLWISVLLPLLLLTTPLFAVANELIGVNYPSRLRIVILLPLLIAFAFTPMLRLPLEITEQTPEHRLRTALFGLVLGCFAMFIFLSMARDFRQRLRVIDNFPIVTTRMQLEWRLLRDETAGGVVLSDPLTSYTIPVLLHAHTVGITPSHTSPFVDPTPRLEAIATVLDPASTDEEIDAVLARYRVTHILLHLEPALTASGAEPIASHYPPGLADRLATHPRLRLVRRNPHLRLYGLRHIE